MKKKTRLLTVLLALALVFSVSMAVSAAPETKAGGEAPAISQSESTVPDSNSVENPGADNPAIQGDAPDEAAPKKSDNTPFFVGAGIAVLMFVGVAVYCKSNGNKSF